ncbi:MAG TPA: hypothetical protein ENN79_02380 [Desulfobacteraceae bacterium]|nr:hypothetical protein [Desulfobacteraceae bacterium]
MKRVAVFLFVVVAHSIAVSGVDSQAMLRVTARGRANPEITNPVKAKAMALRAAKIEGYRMLAEAAGLPREDADGESSRVQAFIQGARIIEQRYISDHEAEVTMTVSASGVIDQVADMRKARFNRKLLSALAKRVETFQTQLKGLESELAKLQQHILQLEERAQ